MRVWPQAVQDAVDWPGPALVIIVAVARVAVAVMMNGWMPPVVLPGEFAHDRQHGRNIALQHIDNDQLDAAASSVQSGGEAGGPRWRGLD
jgi:hypothetical protein